MNACRSPASTVGPVMTLWRATSAGAWRPGVGMTVPCSSPAARATLVHWLPPASLPLSLESTVMSAAAHLVPMDLFVARIPRSPWWLGTLYGHQYLLVVPWVWH